MKIKKRLLLLSDCYPADLTDGKHLRVHNLCKELCANFDCYFVGLSEGNDALTVDTPLPFKQIVRFEERVREGVSWWRRFRLSDGRYVSKSSPVYFAATVARLRQLTREWQVDLAIIFEPRLAEVAMQLDVPRILDYPDSASLALRRRRKNAHRHISLAGKLGLIVKQVRSRNRERYFLRNFTRTVTISEQDRAALLSASGVASSMVVVVPNGVSAAAFHRDDSDRERSRTIVFWGNLAFPPNWTAVTYFFDHVFEPYLAEKGVVWHIVGRDADERIRGIGTRRNVVLAGFQPDLPQYVSNMGAMINPMVEGGGMKNKVLEAFAMKLPVVSSTLGAAAIRCESGRHFLAADTPREFAEQVLAVLDDPKLSNNLAENAKALVDLEYSWSVVGHKYVEVIDDVLGGS